MLLLIVNSLLAFANASFTGACYDCISSDLRMFEKISGMYIKLYNNVERRCDKHKCIVGYYSLINGQSGKAKKYFDSVTNKTDYYCALGLLLCYIQLEEYSNANTLSSHLVKSFHANRRFMELHSYVKYLIEDYVSASEILSNAHFASTDYPLANMVASRLNLKKNTNTSDYLRCLQACDRLAEDRQYLIEYRITFWKTIALERSVLACYSHQYTRAICIARETLESKLFDIPSESEIRLRYSVALSAIRLRRDLLSESEMLSICRISRSSQNRLYLAYAMLQNNKINSANAELAGVQDDLDSDHQYLRTLLLNIANKNGQGILSLIADSRFPAETADLIMHSICYAVKNKMLDSNDAEKAYDIVNKYTCNNDKYICFVKYYTLMNLSNILHKESKMHAKMAMELCPVGFARREDIVILSQITSK